MGTASKVVNVILRVSELISAAVICGIMGHYLHQLDDANGPYSSRVVYSVALAGISIFLSLVLIPPMRYSFFAFPVDFALFIMWMVCFGLLINLSGGASCDSYWMWHNWGYVWGGWWRTVPIWRATPALVTTTYCSNWRAVLAFSFIISILFLLSGCLGAYNTFKDKDPEDLRNSTGDSAFTSEPEAERKPHGDALDQHPQADALDR